VRATRCILLGLSGNYLLAVEDAVALQSSSNAVVFESLERSREVALGATTGGVLAPSGGPRAAVRLIKAITMIQEGTGLY
jgi:hypothetical protein